MDLERYLNVDKEFAFNPANVGKISMQTFCDELFCTPSTTLQLESNVCQNGDDVVHLNDFSENDLKLPGTWKQRVGDKDTPYSIFIEREADKIDTDQSELNLLDDINQVLPFPDPNVYKNLSHIEHNQVFDQKRKTVCSKKLVNIGLSDDKQKEFTKDKMTSVWHELVLVNGLKSPTESPEYLNSEIRPCLACETRPSLDSEIRPSLHCETNQTRANFHHCDSDSFETRPQMKTGITDSNETRNNNERINKQLITQMSVDAGVNPLSNSRQSAYRTRLSLPERLSVERQAARSKENRRVRRNGSGVKFADDFGQILNTFAMIPSRPTVSTKYRNVTGRHAIDPSMQGSGSQTPDCSNGYGYLVVDREWTGYEQRGEQINDILGVTCYQNPQNTYDLSDTSLQCSKNLPTCPNLDNVINLNGPTNPALCYSVTAIGLKSERKPNLIEMISSESCHPIKLRFKQPFASIDTLKSKLKQGMICLENVRVDADQSTNHNKSDQSFPTGLRSSVYQSNSTILCSIKVVNIHWEKKVFARCTNDDWTTYADLPAQYVPDVDNLGYEYDTFCFAVRRPACDAPLDEWEHSTDGVPGSASEERRPRSTVEFSLCYEVQDETYWDNNDGLNYRIEWF